MKNSGLHPTEGDELRVTLVSSSGFNILQKLGLGSTPIVQDGDVVLVENVEKYKEHPSKKILKEELTLSTSDGDQSVAEYYGRSETTDSQDKFLLIGDRKFKWEKEGRK